jgi:hypothetical protein
MRIVSSKQPDGTFYYEVFNGDTLIDSGKGYPTQRDAYIASNVVYHALHAAGFVWDRSTTVHDYEELSIDELLEALEVTQ